MPAHDWTRVDAGIFHDFHNVWIGELRNHLNTGLLPSGYYALTEQHAGKYITDILTLHAGDSRKKLPEIPKGGVALAEAPPKVRRQLSLAATARTMRKSLAIRHVSGDRLIAIIEIVSPANKDRREHLDEFLAKIEDSLMHGVHLLVVDLFPPGKHDPKGMASAIWERLGDEPVEPPDNEPLTLAAYLADTPVKAFLNHLAVGELLSEMPLFLDPDYYVRVPLEQTYQSTWKGTPENWRARLTETPGGDERRAEKTTSAAKRSRDRHRNS